MKKIIQIVFTCFLLISVIFSVSGVTRDQEVESLDCLDYEIIRDDYGVPHVFAETKEALSMGAGYAIAEDRLWQADVFRRQATGRLAELGLADIEYDHWNRLRGYALEENTQLLDELEPQYKEMLTAYSQGINQYITEAIADPTNKMPYEYLQRGKTPEPWTEEDSLAIGQMMVRRWGEGGGNELTFAFVLKTLMDNNGVVNGWRIFNDVCPQTDPGSDTTIDWKEDSNPKKELYLPPIIPDSVIKSAEKIEEIKQMDKEISESMGLLYYFGSNGWVVTPSKSTTGNPLLLGGPQMGHSIPQIVVELGMHGAGINATGMTFPGVGPAIAIGVSKWGAWTTTSGLSDGVDTYIEILHPLNKTKYLFNHRWHDMERRIETIYDADGTPFEVECFRTVHGPVLDFQWTKTRGGIAISQKMTFWKKEHQTLEGVMEFQECTNISEFEQGVSKIVSSHNWFWADRNGDVGYYHSGWYPIRPKRGMFLRKIDDRFPLIGTGKEEWKGIVPFEDLPQARNPKEGFFANWNNKPQADWPYAEAEVGPMWGEGHIVVRIQELLDADEAVNFEDMIEICRNVAYHQAYGTYFKPYLMEAINEVGGISSEVLDALEQWDCYLNNEDEDGFYDEPGLTIFNQWYEEIYDEVLLNEIGTEVQEYTHSILLHVFQEDESKLRLKYKNYLDGNTKNEAIISALENALSALEIEYGTDNVSQWLTPVKIKYFSQVGALTSPEMPEMDRGTYNQIAEMPLWSSNYPSESFIASNVLPPGQNGFVNSSGTPGSHAYDQLDLYVNWEFKPILLSPP